MIVALADTPVLVTERLTLRAPAPRDVDAFVAFYGSERSRFTGGPMDRRAAWHFFSAEIGHWVQRGFGMFAVTRTGDDAALGLVGHWQPVDWPEREVGWLMFEGAEGHGYAAEAARACLDHAWRELGWETAVSYIDPANERSIALARRLGATRDATASGPARRDPSATPAQVWRHPAPEAGR